MEATVVLQFPAERSLETLALRPVLGVPLFVRTCIVLADNGQRDFVLLAPPRLRRSLLRAWQKHLAPRNARLKLLPTTDHNELTPDDTRSLRRAVASRFWLCDALTVVTELWAREVLGPALRYARTTNIGQTCTPRDVEAGTGHRSPVAGYCNYSTSDALTGDRRLATGDAVARKYFRVSDSSDIPALEHFLCEHIRHGANGWMARNVNKRISLPISRILARLRVSPNTITIFNMLIGLAAGIGTGGRTYVGLLWGGILFQTASIMDGCDGEVAKLTFRQSQFGQMIDTLSDNFALTSFFVGLTIHQYRVQDSFTGFLWAGLFFSGTGLLIYRMVKFLRRHTNSMSLVTFDKEFIQTMTRGQTDFVSLLVRGCKPILKKEWFTTIFLGMAILGVLPWALYGAALVGWIGVWVVSVLEQRQRAMSTSAHRHLGTSAQNLAAGSGSANAI